MNLKQRIKPVYFILLAVFLLSSLLGGCGGKAGEAVNSTSVTSAAPADSTAAVESTSEQKLEPAVITQYIMGGENPDIQSVIDEANKILKEKINASLDLKIVDWGSYEQKIKLITASAEAFDLCFTSGWYNNFYENVSRGALLPLDDLLTKYAPKAYGQVPLKYWDAAKVDNKIYGFLNYQIFARTDNVVIRKDIASKYGFDTESVNKMSDLTPLFEQINKNEPDLISINFGGLGNSITHQPLSLGFETLSGYDVPGAVQLEDKSCKVVNQFELPSVIENLKLMREWYVKGYFIKDIATVSTTQDDRCAVLSRGTYKPGGLADFAKQFKTPVDNIAERLISKTWATTSGIAGTMHGISSTSTHPERTMMYLELVNTDKDLYNLLVFGIKDKHYKITPDGFVQLIEQSGYSNSGWIVGNQFNAMLMEGQPEDSWEQTIKLNEEANLSPIVGFVVDTAPIKTQIAQCQAVCKEFIPLLGTGSVDLDKIMPEFLEKLKKAGSEEIIAEMQKQVDKWKQATGK